MALVFGEASNLQFESELFEDDLNYVVAFEELLNNDGNNNKTIRMEDNYNNLYENNNNVSNGFASSMSSSQRLLYGGDYQMDEEDFPFFPEGGDGDAYGFGEYSLESAILLDCDRITQQAYRSMPLQQHQPAKRSAEAMFSFGDAKGASSQAKKVRYEAPATPVMPAHLAALSATICEPDTQLTKQCVEFMLLDVLSNDRALSFQACEEESSWRVVHSGGAQYCELQVCLYVKQQQQQQKQQQQQTAVVKPDEPADYVLELLHLYGDREIFTALFHRVQAAFASSSERSEVVPPHPAARPLGNVEFFAAPENRVILEAQMCIPEDAVDAQCLHERRQQGVRTICDLSADPAMGATLVELRAVPQLLRVFAHHEAAQPVACLDNALLPDAVTALHNLLHCDKAAQQQMADHIGFLQYLARRVQQSATASSVPAVAERCAAILRVLFATHHEQLQLCLGVSTVGQLLQPRDEGSAPPAAAVEYMHQLVGPKHADMLAAHLEAIAF